MDEPGFTPLSWLLVHCSLLCLVLLSGFLDHPLRNPFVFYKKYSMSSAEYSHLLGVRDFFLIKTVLVKFPLSPIQI